MASRAQKQYHPYRSNADERGEALVPDTPTGYDDPYVQKPYQTTRDEDAPQYNAFRRREERRNTYGGKGKIAPANFPPAPDAPRLGKEKARHYADTLGEASSSRRAWAEKRYYAAHKLSQERGSGQANGTNYEAGHGPKSPLSPLSAGKAPAIETNTFAAPKQRRGSVPDRSPLQKLEVKLDDISKEEKRARLQDAELLAQERADARRRSSQTRNVSGPQPPTQPAAAKSGSEKRHASLPSNGKIDLGVYDRQYRRGTVGGIAAPRSERPNRSHGYEEASESAGVNRTASQATGGAQENSRYYRPTTRDSSGRDGATGLGLSGVNEPSPLSPAAVGVPRTGSRKLTKTAPQSVRDKEPSNNRQQELLSNRTGQKHGRSAARDRLDPDPIPPETVLNRNDTGPKYEIPPQTAAGQRARERIEFADTVITEDAHHHTLHNPFHRSHDHDRRYQAPKPLDEWRLAGVARLAGNDLNLEEPDVESGSRTRSERRRSSDVQAESGYIYDGGRDARPPQTAFDPPLYLKCGPLLRFTGIKTDRSRIGRGSDVWRGSVMIVTIDSRSKYTPTPRLRLFKQHIDLLPPPPKYIDHEGGEHLDPAYVDPVAGQSKMSRTGKTLYVKPVEDLDEGVDLSRIEDDTGLFEETRTAPIPPARGKNAKKSNGEKLGRYRDVKGVRLHAERGVTFWRFNLEIELAGRQQCVAYRINKGPATSFWVPARGQTMNIMFHSCNGFSLSVDPNQFCGPDPLWRDVLNNHQTRPFHVMIGGGDQIYNDAAMRQTKLFQEWTASKNPTHKSSTPFSQEMQNELEDFYLNRYSMWFSQGLFGMANSQIPMVNIWDDHDIIDGFGSYPHHFMSTPVFSGLGAVAYKYYMLFQHQSVSSETEEDEPSWLLGAARGPYINELSRSVFMSLGRSVAFVGLDCRTERMRDSILTDATYDRIFDRCEREINHGETKHLIVLLGVPIAYPRLNFMENVLTSRIMDPVKAIGRTGLLGNFVNKFDGGVEILDDLDDHWTAKHHKGERNWFIKELQLLAAEKSVRITILGGDVHLAAVGEFFTSKDLGIPKDRDHRYMPNVISSAIVNTPPPNVMADVLNKRNKIHHLRDDDETDEDMIPLFTHDVDGKPRNNKHLLPRRNWCSIREYVPSDTPPSSEGSTSPRPDDPSQYPPGKLKRTLSDRITRRFSKGGPPVAFETQGSSRHFAPPPTPPPASSRKRRGSTGGLSTHQRDSDLSSYRQALDPPHNPPRPNPFHRRPTGLSDKATFANDDDSDDLSVSERGGNINLEYGLDIVLNVEVSQKDPAGITTPYRLLVPALDYEPGQQQTRPDSSREREHSPSQIAAANMEKPKRRGSLLKRVFSVRSKRKQAYYDSEEEEEEDDDDDEEEEENDDEQDAIQAEADRRRPIEPPSRNPTSGGPLDHPLTTSKHSRRISNSNPNPPTTTGPVRRSTDGREETGRKSMRKVSDDPRSPPLSHQNQAQCQSQNTQTTQSQLQSQESMMSATYTPGRSGDTFDRSAPIGYGGGGGGYGGGGRGYHAGGGEGYVDRGDRGGYEYEYDGELHSPSPPLGEKPPARRKSWKIWQR